jgi:potassium efflux system protein
MKQIRILIIFSLLLVLNHQVFSQENSTDSLQVKKEIISVENVSSESEKLDKRNLRLRLTLRPSESINEIDSILKSVTKEIIKKRGSVLSEIGDTRQRTLIVRKVEWNNYKTKLDQYQSVLKSRTEEISNISINLYEEKNKWEFTKQELSKNSDSKDFIIGMDKSISSLNEMVQIAQERMDNVYSVQKSLVDLFFIVNEVISEIERAQIRIKKDYFVFDSKSIWVSNKVGKDSTSVNSLGHTQLIINGLKENKQQLKDFFSLNLKEAVFQGIFILLLLMFMFRINKKWNTNLLESNSLIEKQARIILSHPISSSLVVGVFISIFFYEALIPTLVEFEIFILLISTIVLLPKLTVLKFRWFLVLLFLTYLIQTFESYLGAEASVYRWLMIVNSIILIFALNFGIKVIKNDPDSFSQIRKTFKRVGFFYIFLLLISVITNSIGMVSLAKFLNTAIISSYVLGMVIYLAVKVLISLIVIFFKFKKEYSLQTLTNMIAITEKRIQPILNWSGMIVWLIITSKGFGILDFILVRINEMMLLEWEVGEMTISFGGILSFLGILIITLFIAKLIAILFRDEWMVKVFPKGVTPAISLILRILLVSIGLYVGSSAAGIDLSKLGFIIGALGVGIGFGMQNIVLNFISGLILAFERPINIGDTIEIDQEFGVVTNIGIRSSNIKSYSGYESIIPNGDLIAKKVNNYTLSNRDRRSKINMKTAANVEPNEVIELFNSIANEHSNIFKTPEPKTYFYGYDPEGNLSFALIYWSTFSDTLRINSEIALNIYNKLKELDIQAPVPIRRIIED